jgi:hypothetical protein
MPSRASTDQGFSGTPLIKKLGVKDTTQILVVNAPSGYSTWLGPLPP